MTQPTAERLDAAAAGGGVQDVTMLKRFTKKLFQSEYEPGFQFAQSHDVSAESESPSSQTVGSRRVGPTFILSILVIAIACWMSNVRFVTYAPALGAIDRARVAYANHRFNEAAEEYAIVLKQLPGHTPSLARMGLSLYEAGREAEAMQVLHDVLYGPSVMDFESSTILMDNVVRAHRLLSSRGLQQRETKQQ